MPRGHGVHFCSEDILNDFRPRAVDSHLDAKRDELVVDLADAGTRAAVESYISAALAAYTEVESALAADAFLAREDDRLREATRQAVAARRLAEERYAAGLEEYITVLESQRRALQADGEWIGARRERLENRVDLYLALGGGFERDDPLPTDTRPTSPGETETEK